MRAAVFNEFKGPIEVGNVPDPVVPADGVVVRVRANGICRSDWHAWQGHDSDVALPHVPGHELAGIIEAVGPDVRGWRAGERVTVPFVAGCGRCEFCLRGQQQVCAHQFQPGFTGWGAFAEFVAIEHADTNLVRLPDSLDHTSAASLGCRFSTAFRAVVERGRVGAGEWLAVHGCGGVGLSAVMIGAACGARVIAVDISAAQLALAREFGAEVLLNAETTNDVPGAIIDSTGGGAHLSIDGLGSRSTLRNSLLCLRPQGRHVQVGLTLGQDLDPPIPMQVIIAKELRLLGSHGMAAHRFEALFNLVARGAVNPKRLIGRTVDLDEGVRILQQMDDFAEHGIAVITTFR